MLLVAVEAASTKALILIRRRTLACAKLETG